MPELFLSPRLGGQFSFLSADKQAGWDLGPAQERAAPKGARKGLRSTQTHKYLPSQPRQQGKAAKLFIPSTHRLFWDVPAPGGPVLP